MAKIKPVVPAEKYPAVGTFTDSKALKKYYKHLSDAELTEWLGKANLSYNAAEHASIDRMRKCMAILYYHFPKEAPTPKAASPYAAYTLEQLVGMAVEHSVPVEVTDNERIMRMRTIMALRAHKIIG